LWAFEVALFELKATYLELNPDTKYMVQLVGSGWNASNLINFNNIYVPNTNRNRYLVQSRAVDLFKPEREAQKRLKIKME